MRGYEVRQLPNNKHVGFGYLCPPAPVGEIAERHTAMIGTKYIVLRWQHFSLGKSHIHQR